uniref:Uncharacterized protein n=1 Tax=Bionectria ochroleuca TaxID=29856 RepID=A0A8H7NBY5_BIOOC
MGIGDGQQRLLQHFCFCLLAKYGPVQCLVRAVGLQNMVGGAAAQRPPPRMVPRGLPPPLERFETLYNTETAEGSGHMREAWSGQVQQHGYWGSMRDRLPLAQTESLVGEKYARGDSQSQSSEARIRVPGKKNLAIIRSGQDWLITTPEERELYLTTMHPVLEKGMDFLRDQGDEVGCYSCRFMNIIDPVTRKADKERTFGLAFFDDLASLESWCKDHPTHLAIFGGFHRYAKKLGMNVSLRVFHEVMVLEPEQQFFEYIGCHPGTGMLL